MDQIRLERCPVCRARFRGDEADDLPCRRCGSDLSQLRALHRLATHSQSEARRALREDDGETALEHARRAVSLVDDELTRRTLSAVLVALERPAEALAVIENRESESVARVGR